MRGFQASLIMHKKHTAVYLNVSLVEEYPLYSPSGEQQEQLAFHQNKDNLVYS